ncbi:hypothetical protein V5O48_018675 [Marasmius crinis-equi]|uniref:Uncharacterized protein n=1 Tax=Marasmius crinis-equi TaxID=585013 RepID=A0ABR3EKK4_9AGAR
MALALLPVSLANVAIESLLYGIFLILTAGSLVLAIQYLPRSQPSTRVRPASTLGRVISVLKRPMFIGSAPLFLTVTAHWVTTVVRSFEAFMSFNNGTDPTSYYADVSQPTYVIKTSLLFASVIISDTMMVYRLWVIWNYNYPVVVLPLLTVVVLLACGIGTTHLRAVAPTGTVLRVDDPEANKWVVADVVLPLLTNTYSSTLIAWRIWVTHRANKEYGGGVVSLRPGSTNLMAALAMFVESAVLFSVWVLFFASVYGAKSNLTSLAEDQIAVMAGIAFSLINVHIGLGRAKSLAAENTTATSAPGLQYALGDTVGTEDLAYPMRPRVHIHQIKSSTTDYVSDPKAMLDTSLREDNESN